MSDTSAALELWPVGYCEFCGTQEPGPLLWFLNHAVCRDKAGRV